MMIQNKCVLHISRAQAVFSSALDDPEEKTKKAKNRIEKNPDPSVSSSVNMKSGDS
jgi:hypothetical protein